MSILGVFAGKAFGGVVADRIGFRTTAIFSLIVAATLFVPSWEIPIYGPSRCIFFNFTISITLASLANILPQHKGTAFGLASFSLAVVRCLRSQDSIERHTWYQFGLGTCVGRRSYVNSVSKLRAAGHERMQAAQVVEA